MAKMKKAVKKKAAKKKAAKSRSTRSAAEQSTAGQQPGPEKTQIAPTPTAGKKILDFEKALDEVIEADKEQENDQTDQTDQPAKRPIGRPPKAESLIKKAITLWPPVLKIPFDFWAENQEIEELRITQNEAELLAIPITQLVDHYLPQLPDIAVAWFGLVSAGYAILGPRLQIIKQRRKDKGAPGPSSKPPQGGGPTKTPVGAPTVQHFPNLDQVTKTENV